MMAEGATGSRAAQKMVMAGIVHERKTDQEIGRLLQQIESSGGELDEAQAALVREAKRECDLNMLGCAPSCVCALLLVLAASECLRAAISNMLAKNDYARFAVTTRRHG